MPRRDGVRGSWKGGTVIVEEQCNSYPVGRAESHASYETMSRSSGTSSFVSRVNQKSGDLQDGGELELYEYGDFLEAFNTPPTGQVCSDDRHLAVISQEQLNLVRHANAQDQALMMEVLKSVVMINGSDVLILACGSSVMTRKIAEYSPARLDLVDIDERALARTCYGLRRAGLDTVTQVSVYNEDAATFVSEASAKYDLIVCVHSIGQICDSQQAVDNYVGSCRDMLKPGGHLLVNHHVGFTDKASPTISGLHDRQAKYLASGLGLFESDCNYEIMPSLAGCALRASWSNPDSAHVMQEWDYKLFECLPPVERDVYTRIEPMSYGQLRPMPVLEDVVNCDLFDMMYPISARGVKVPVAPEDESSVSRSNLMPKFDGQACVIVIGDETCTVISPTQAGAFKAPFYMSETVCVTAELCTTSMGDSTAIITGVLSVGEVRCDPTSEHWLAWARKNLSGLASVGIICNTPALVKDIVGDKVLIPGAPNGRSIGIDGLNVCVAGRWNKFMKGLSTTSADAKPTDMMDALEMVPALRDKIVVPALDWSEDEEGVVEYRVRQRGESARLEYHRPRADKARSDTRGKLLVFFRGLEFLLSPLGPRTTRGLVTYLEAG